MIELLQKIFSNISLMEIDNSKEIVDSTLYRNFLDSFPNLSDIFDLGIKRDEQEFIRTIKHVFRSIKIYLEILDKTFSYEGFSDKTTIKIFNKIQKIQECNPLLIPLILMYHDIGKFVRKRDHPHQSFILITKENLLSPYHLVKDERMLIVKVIQYHILFASIYTGESTYYGTYSLINDNLLVRLLSDKKYLNLFVDLLEIFTFIDILGYHYAMIYDHYIEFFEEINFKLKEILQHWQQKSRALDIAKKYSIEWIDWRIAGGLRIFQFVKTKPYLTKQFYFNKLKESILHEDNLLTPNLDWKMIKNKYLINSYKIQIKYGLGILMLLSFGSFHRNAIKLDQKISPNLVLFWISLTKEIEFRTNEQTDYLWNVFFIGLPHWSKWNKLPMNRLNYNTISFIIQKSSHVLDKEKKEYTLYLDFKYLFE